MKKLKGFKGDLMKNLYTELRTNNLVIQKNVGSLENPQIEEVSAIERGKLAEIISDTLATWVIECATELKITMLEEPKKLWRLAAEEISGFDKMATYGDLVKMYAFFGILRLTERYQSKLAVSDLEVTYDNIYMAIYNNVMKYQDSLKSDNHSDSESTRISGILARTRINSWLSRLEIVTSGVIISHSVKYND